MELKESIYIDGVEYRYIELRGRGKYISKNGDAINPLRKAQKVTIHYNSDGYPCFGGGVPVHLYVAHAWVDGYFEGSEVNHKDFDRTNYKADNLEWVSHNENVEYSVEKNPMWNKSRQGIHNGRARFSIEEVLEIRRMYDSGMSVADIIKKYFPELIHAKDYRSIHSTFLAIAKRITWKCIPEE